MASFNQHVSVTGLGYVGLPTAALVASGGVRVTGIDINPTVVERVNSGDVQAAEDDVSKLVCDATLKGFLSARTNPVEAGVHIIATPTPIRSGNLADTSAVESAAESLAPVLAPGNLIIIESTCPVGTTASIAMRLFRLRPDLTFPHNAPERADIMVAYCPERVLPGQTLRELTGNDRIVGGLDNRSAAAARAFYRRFVTGEISLTNAETAELAKLLENAYRDVNIAFANEVSLVADHFGVDARSVISLANRHPRVNILNPGTGAGGHCIPVDPWFIHEAAPDLTPLIRTARDVNDRKPEWVAERILSEAAKTDGAPIALLGLAYKPDIDDLRGSPAIAAARVVCAKRQGPVIIADPHIAELPPALAGMPGVTLEDAETAIKRAATVAVLCAHSRFAELDRQLFRSKRIIDPSGFLDEANTAAIVDVSDPACVQAS